MSDSPGPDGSMRLNRRSLLAAGTVAATASTAGCMRRLRSIVNRDGIDQLSLTITTLPADADREGIQLARRLRDVLEDVGVHVSIEMRGHTEFLMSVLVNQDFDIFVGRHPGSTDPDFLYEALYSRYADESGWQNPYGYTNMTFDSLLEAQRRAEGEQRREAVGRLLEAFVEERPFVPICIPDEIRVVRSDRFDGWGEYHPATRLGHLALEPIGDIDELQTVVIDARPSQNLNPLSAEYRNRGTFVDLLYDSLATEADGEVVPWIAESWEWIDEGAGENGEGNGTDDEIGRDSANEGGGTFEIRLREDLAFHDGEPLTAYDVEFTYRFLEDTSLGRSEVASPAPRYRGLTSPVEAVTVEGRRDLSLSIDAGRAVAERALTVPILPEHVWDDRAEEAAVPGFEVAPGTTEAVVAENVPAVGSGPFRFESRAVRDSLTLERFEDHFTLREDVDLPSASVETLHAEIDPRSTSAIEIVEAGDADSSTSTLETYAIEGVEEGDGVELLESPSATFFQVGFNARKAPYSNPHFRRAVARLLDREWLVEEVFGGYAQPTLVPVAEEWTPDSLAWDGADPVTPFLGDDGDLDVDAAREAFLEAGFQYDGDGNLLVRD